MNKPSSENQHKTESEKTQHLEQPADTQYAKNKQNIAHFQNKCQASKNTSPFKQLQMENLPIQITEIIKQNKYLQRQNAFLTQQLQQKQQQIQVLKHQIYQSILDQTQSKLHCIRIIEQQANIKAKRMFEDKVSHLDQNDQNLEQMQDRIDSLMLQLKKQKKANQILATNVVQLKDFIIAAMEQKDLIIRQLKCMIQNSDDSHNHNPNQPVIPFSYYKQQFYSPSNIQNQVYQTNKIQGKNVNDPKNYIPSKNPHQIYPSQTFKTTKAKIVRNL